MYTKLDCLQLHDALFLRYRIKTLVCYILRPLYLQVLAQTK